MSYVAGDVDQEPGATAMSHEQESDPIQYTENRESFARLGRRGRKPGPKRIKVNAVVLEDGRQKHLFSIITTKGLNTVMRVMQALRDDTE